jgi:hypothetical protein
MLVFSSGPDIARSHRELSPELKPLASQSEMSRDLYRRVLELGAVHFWMLVLCVYEIFYH